MIEPVLRYCRIATDIIAAVL